MARTKKIEVVIKSSRDEQEWVAEAQDGSGLSARNPLPSLALSTLGAQLREHHRADVEISYHFELSPGMRAQLEALLEKERRLQQLLTEVPADRFAFATACLRRNMKQADIAQLMGLSQGYLNQVLKRVGSGDRVKINPRRRTPS